MWREYFLNNIDAIEVGLKAPQNKMIYFLAEFIGEAENGGVEQYLFNESGNNFIQLYKLVIELEMLANKNMLSDIKERLDLNEKHEERGARLKHLNILESKSGCDIYDALENEFAEKQHFLEVEFSNYIKTIT